MFSCIVRGAIVSRSKKKPTGVKASLGKWVPEVIVGRGAEQIHLINIGPRVRIAENRVELVYRDEPRSLESAKVVAMGMLADMADGIRDAGFVSPTTGEHTGKITPQSIAAMTAMGASALAPAALGSPVLGAKGTPTKKKRAFKLAKDKGYIKLTDSEIVAMQNEITGADGFLQKVYNREAAIAEAISAVKTSAEAVNKLYIKETKKGWPK